MKTFKFFALVGTISLLLIIQPTTASRMETFQLDGTYNYVVIGAFKYQRNASRFTSHALKDWNMEAHFQLNANRNLYYVYVLTTDDRTYAITEAKRLRTETEFSDTWVYSGALGKSAPITEAKISKGVDINPVTEQTMENVVQKDPVTHGGEEVKADPEANQSLVLPETVEAVTPESTPAIETQSSGALDTGGEGKPFLFKISRSIDHEVVEGDVAVIDSDRSRKMATYKANTVVKVSDPASKSDNVSLVCEVFGYRKVQRDINYVNPEGEGIQLNEQGAVEVPFELMRLQKGDIAVMYNVYFFRDASVMRPESRYEVNSLLEMLNENPNYKIRIHGHTNGGAHGKIISPEKGSTDFFSLNNTKEGIGTAKQLSEARGNIIRDYMLANGIAENRMQVKAWGGKKPIHDKLSTRAQENVRVEIEILEH